MADDLVLEMRDIRKEFPGVVANDGVSFDVRRGEVHALLGENGAGKSTLMNILYGLYRPDGGEITLNGKPVSFSSAREAIEAGIGMVHQHFMLIPVMTVAENIVLGTEPVKGGVFLDEKAADRRVDGHGQDVPLRGRPDALVEDISVGQQQRVEIMKALYRNADLLILDEPTAVLTPQEASDLFEILRTLRREGISIIFISHKLNEVLEIADRITVLRRGKTIETVPREGATEESLARAMVGREVLLRVEKAPAHPGRRPARGARPPRPRRPRDREGARRLLRRPRRRDRRHRRSRRERPDGADRRAHRAPEDRERDGEHRRPRARARRRPRRARRRDRAHPRGPAAPRPRARVLDRREHRAARLREAARRDASAGSSRGG